MRNYVTLYLGGEDAPIAVDTFVVAAQKFFRLLKEIELSVAGNNKNTLKWIVNELRHGSAFLGTIAINEQKVPYTGDEIAQYLVNGLNLLEKESKRPGYFSDNAIQCAKELAEMVYQRKTTISISTQDKTAQLTSKLANHADKLLTTFIEYGTIEGALKMVSVAGPPVCNIYDDITKRSVKCLFDYTMLGQIANAIDHRVSITGKISYTDEGYPRNIVLSSMDIFPLDDELPSTDDLLKMGIDLSGGLTIEELMERTEYVN
jgi:hypothetical protein